MLKKDEVIKILTVVTVPILVVVVIFFSFFNTTTSNTTTKNTPSFSDLANRQIVSIIFNSYQENDLNQEVLKVEVVNTLESITQGLSGRSTIGADGMLFVFQNKEQQYFWMKDMQFNIDIVWIADTTVVDITRDVQKPEDNTPDNRLKIYPSQAEVNMVLELPAGDAHRYGITQGKTIQLAQ